MLVDFVCLSAVEFVEAVHFVHFGPCVVRALRVRRRIGATMYLGHAITLTHWRISAWYLALIISS